MPKRVRFRLSKCEIEATKRVLEKKYESEDELLDDTREDYLICKDVSPEQAEEVMNKKYGLIMYYEEGSLFAVELTRKDHSCVAGRMISMLLAQLPNMLDLSHGSGEDVVISQTQRRQPDSVLEPSLPRPNLNQPTLVVEVAVSQSLKSAYRSATEYLSAATHIQVVLVIKLWKGSMVATGQLRRMLMLAFFRSPANVYGPSGMLVPQHVISFGNSGISLATCNYLVQWGVQPQNIRGLHLNSHDLMCSGPQQVPYVFTIPHHLVFFGANQYVAPPNGFIVDLYTIQREALLFDQ